VTAAAMQGGREPVRPDHFEGNATMDSSKVKNGVPSPSTDPCNGTGGTGQVLRVGADEITISRRQGGTQVIHFTADTQIRSASGPANKADLKVGDGVTIVTGSSPDDQMVAALVLICGAKR